MTPTEKLLRIHQAENHLLTARALLMQACCPRSLDKVRSAINSVRGAARNAERFQRAEEPQVRHTACMHCGLDVEGMAPFPAGEWRDRGNNTHCPAPKGEFGQPHEATP